MQYRSQAPPGPVLQGPGGLHGRLTVFRTCFTDVLLNLVPVLLILVPVLLNLVPVLLILGPVLLNLGRFWDLPHASLLVRRQNPVSVIISCKTVRNRCVENTALSPDEDDTPGAACCGVSGGIWTTLSRDISGSRGCAHWRHFIILTIKSPVGAKQAH